MSLPSYPTLVASFRCLASKVASGGGGGGGTYTAGDGLTLTGTEFAVDGTVMRTGTLSAGDGLTFVANSYAVDGTVLREADLGTNVQTFLLTPSSANLLAAMTTKTGTGNLVFGTAPTITLANGTGLPISTGVSGLGTGVATFLATPSSTNLAAAMITKTGSGNLVFGNAPTLLNPIISRIDNALSTAIAVFTGTGADYFTFSSGTGTVDIAATGSSTNITISLTPKGTGTATYQTYEVGWKRIPQNSQSAAYTTVLADTGKHIFHPAADTTARIWTIDSNANVPYPLGTAITFIVETGSGVITLAITSDTLVLAGVGSTGSRTLTGPAMATAVKITSTKWMISGSGIT